MHWQKRRVGTGYRWFSETRHFAMYALPLESGRTDRDTGRRKRNLSRP